MYFNWMLFACLMLIGSAIIAVWILRDSEYDGVKEYLDENSYEVILKFWVAFAVVVVLTAIVSWCQVVIG